MNLYLYSVSDSMPDLELCQQCLIEPVVYEGATYDGEDWLETYMVMCPQCSRQTSGVDTVDDAADAWNGGFIHDVPE